MKNQAKLEEKRIETKRGIVNQFLKQRGIMSNNNSDKNKITISLLDKDGIFAYQCVNLVNNMIAANGDNNGLGVPLIELIKKWVATGMKK